MKNNSNYLKCKKNKDNNNYYKKIKKIKMRKKNKN